MVRTQIQLTDEQARRVKQLAAQQQISMATLIRQGVDLLLKSAHTRVTDEERIERALAAAGKFRSGSGDGSVRHDQHLAEAYKR